MDSVSRYFKEIASTASLCAEEEAMLFEAIRKGDTKARDKIIKANLLFVISRAKKLLREGKGLQLDDLINEGNIGLLYAIDKFDEKRGIRFLSYAVFWIDKYIKKAVYETGAIIRLPVHKAGLLKRIEKAREILEGDLQREISVEELTEYLNLSKEDIATITSDLRIRIGLDVPVISTHKTINKEVPLHSILAEETDTIEASIIKKEEEQRIDYLLALLTKKQRLVIELYYGLSSEGSLSLQGIGERLCISGERVRQLKDAALLKLKGRLNSKDGCSSN